MAAARSTFSAAAAAVAAVLVLCTATLGQQQQVEPRCPRPFAAPAPSCFCSRARNNDWTVTCGCPNSTFPAGQEVVLTPKLLPPVDADRATDGLTIALLGCWRPVRLSEQLLAAADARFASITLEVRDTERLLLPEPPPAGLPPLRYSSVTALLERVSVPRITGALFSRRIAVSARFTDVQIGEIAAGAFQQTLVGPNVTIVDSRVGRIAGGAFDLPVGGTSAESPLAGLKIIRSEVAEWASGGHTGGALLHVLDSNVTRLRTGAVSTTGLLQLYWNGNAVGEAEPAAVYQHLVPPNDTLPPTVLAFYGNTFQTAPAAGNDSRGLLHFEHGVPSALQFIDNSVWGAAAAPVTPEPRLQQVVGTRLQCRCALLEPWLAGSGAFLSAAQCRPSPAGDLPLRRAADFYRSQCDAADLPDGPGEDTRRAPPSSSAARLAVAAIIQLAAGFYSSRTVM